MLLTFFGLAYGAGASYALQEEVRSILSEQHLTFSKEFLHKGFSIIDCASICPTYYGRKNKKGSAVDMMKWQKENTVMREKAVTMSPEELKGKMVVGVLAHTNYPEFTSEYQKIIDKLAREAENHE